MITEDFGIGEGFKFIGDNFDLAPGQTSATYDCYFYFFTGTGWQKTKDFYDSVARKPDFEIEVSPDSTTADPHLPTSFEITVESLNGFNQPVTLSTVFDSHEISGTFANNVVTPPANDIVTTTLTVSVLSEEMTTHQIYITGISGSLSHTKSVSLLVPFMSVPYFSQGAVPWCGPTSIAMIMQFYGIEVHSWDVASGLRQGHSDVFGLWQYLQLNSYLSGYGLAAEVLGFGFVNEDSLKLMLQKGEPVALEVPSLQHIVVLTGYLSDNFYVNDPSGALLDAIFGGGTKVPYIEVPVPWNSLTSYLPWNSYAVGMIGSSSSPPTGILNLLGQDSHYWRTITVSHAKTNPWTDNLFIWQSGYTQDVLDTKGLTWHNDFQHPCWLDTEDYFVCHDPTHNGLMPLIFNPTDTVQSYKFKITFSKSSFETSIDFNINNVSPCGYSGSS